MDKLLTYVYENKLKVVLGVVVVVVVLNLLFGSNTPVPEVPVQ